MGVCQLPRELSQEIVIMAEWVEVAKRRSSHRKVINLVVPLPSPHPLSLQFSRIPKVRHHHHHHHHHPGELERRFAGQGKLGQSWSGDDYDVGDGKSFLIPWPTITKPQSSIRRAGQKFVRPSSGLGSP